MVKKIKLLFVCTYNQIRSVAAENLFKNNNKYIAKSVGILDNIISKEDVIWADRIFVMEGNHKEYIMNNFSEYLEEEPIVLYIKNNNIRSIKTKIKKYLGNYDNEEEIKLNKQQILDLKYLIKKTLNMRMCKCIDCGIKFEGVTAKRCKKCYSKHYNLKYNQTNTNVIFEMKRKNSMLKDKENIKILKKYKEKLLPELTPQEIEDYNEQIRRNKN